MIDCSPVPSVNQQTVVTSTNDQQVTTPTNDEIQQEATVEPNKNTTNEKLVDEDKMAEREEATGLSSDAATKVLETQSKELSSEQRFQDAEKAIEDKELDDDNDSEYEDVDDDEDEIDEENHPSASNTIGNNEDDERINIKPRRLPKKRDEDEHSEVYEEDDPQNSPNTTELSTRPIEKESDKNVEPLDDDNDSRNPAYVPRKGKFYEHDDRTTDEPGQTKPDMRKTNRSRIYRDLDSKWQHDLYWDYDEDTNFPRTSYRGRMYQHKQDHFRRYDGNSQKRLHLNDYIPPLRRGRARGGFRQQQYYDDEDDYRQQPPSYVKSRGSGRMNNFDFNDYNRPSAHHNRGRGGNRYDYVEKQAPPRRQRQKFEQYQTDETPVLPRHIQSYSTSEQGFLRERNFTNTQYQQQRSTARNNNRVDQRPSSEHSSEINQDDKKGKNRGQRHEANEPPRRQTNINRNQQQQQDENSATNSKLSADAPSFERPKRYSNMRSSVSNSVQQQQQQQQQQSQMSMQPYQDQRAVYYDRNHWQQLPPPSPYIPQQQQQQILTPPIYHPQQPIPPTFYVHPQYQQPSPYPPINYSQGSLQQPIQENK